MTDGGALPIAFSRSVAGLCEAGWLAATVTVGQAFGGDLEAVNVHTGLLAAAHVLHADVAIVAQGPGNLGTGSPWGYSGVATGEAVNATAVLGGRADRLPARLQADQRERHRGISHHSLTAYGRVAMAPADLPVPVLGGELGDRVLEQAKDLVRDSAGRLRLHEVDVSGLVDALASSPVRLSTMGRGLDQDEASFVTAAAAGRFAATLLGPTGTAGSRQAIDCEVGWPSETTRSSQSSSTRGIRCSADVDQVHDEDQGLARLDRSAGAAVAIGEVRGDGQLAAAADLHARRCPRPSP